MMKAWLSSCYVLDFMGWAFCDVKVAKGTLNLAICDHIRKIDFDYDLSFLPLEDHVKFNAFKSEAMINECKKYHSTW